MDAWTRNPEASTLAMFAAAVPIGGANFVAVRISNRELDFLWGAGLRFALAGGCCSSRSSRRSACRGREGGSWP